MNNRNEDRYPWATGIFFGAFLGVGVSMAYWTAPASGQSIVAAVLLGLIVGAIVGIITWHNESN